MVSYNPFFWILKALIYFVDRRIQVNGGVI